MTRDEIVKKIARLKQETWICKGPNRTGGFAGTVPTYGEEVNYSSCMWRPDCSCTRFQDQADRIEELEDKLMECTFLEGEDKNEA